MVKMYISVSNHTEKTNQWRQRLFLSILNIKGTVMQIEKALINDCLRVSKVSWNSHSNYL